MRTLFVHSGGMGDFLLACPALAHLSHNRTVTLAGHRERLEIAVEAGLAESAVRLDAIDFGSLFSTPSPRLQAFASNFDEAIVWMGDDDGLITQGLHACGVEEVRCFPGLPRANWTKHATAYYLDCLGLPETDGFQITIAPNKTFNGWIIHPGSGSARKNWPVERFAEVADYLQHRGRTVRWCLGPAEEAFQLPDGAVPLRLASPVALAHCLAAAEGYVGNDSGVSHLAAMLGCPTVAIFGPTDPGIWAPRGPRVRVVHETPWPTVEKVLTALP